MHTEKAAHKCTVHWIFSQLIYANSTQLMRQVITSILETSCMFFLVTNHSPSQFLQMQVNTFSLLWSHLGSLVLCVCVTMWYRVIWVLLFLPGMCVMFICIVMMSSNCFYCLHTPLCDTSYYSAVRKFSVFPFYSHFE